MSSAEAAEAGRRALCSGFLCSGSVALNWHKHELPEQWQARPGVRDGIAGCPWLLPLCCIRQCNNTARMQLPQTPHAWPALRDEVAVSLVCSFLFFFFFFPFSVALRPHTNCICSTAQNWRILFSFQSRATKWNTRATPQDSDLAGPRDHVGCDRKVENQ